MNACFNKRLTDAIHGMVLSALLLTAANTHSAAEENKQNPEQNTCQTETGIAYRTGNDLSEYTRERCRIDFHHPTTKGYATVVWFHGGGLTSQDRFIPKELTGKGIAIAAAGYRLSPKAKAPEYIEDAAAAVAWVFHHVEEYGGSKERIFVSGHSAGAYLACMIALDKRYLEAYGVDANRLAGVAPLSGNTITHFTIRGERNIPPTKPVIDEYAPLFHVRSDAPPILLVTGDRELELYGRYEENAYFQRMMQINGHKHTELHELKGKDHGSMLDPSYPLLLDFIQSHPARKQP